MAVIILCYDSLIMASCLSLCRFMHRDRERETNRDTERETETDRQTDTDRQTETDRQTDSGIQTDRGRQTDRKTDRERVFTGSMAVRTYLFHAILYITD